MANLPSLQHGAGLLNVPEQSGSFAAHMAAPYTMIAEATGFLGNRLEKALEPEMRRQGAEAVVRDADGNLQVRNRVEWMDSDRAFMAGARMAYRVQRLDETSRVLRDLRRQHQGEPQAFQTAADTAIRQMIRDTPRDMRQYVEGDMVEESRRYGEGLADQRLQLDSQRTVNALQSRITTLNADIDALVQGERGTGTDAYRQRVEELTDARRQLAALPFSTYTQEQFAADQQDRRNRDIIQGAAGDIFRKYRQDGDIAAAEKAAEDVANASSLPLSAADRVRVRNEIMGMVRTGQAARSEQLVGLRQRASLMSDNYRNGRNVPDEDFNSLTASLRAAGAPADAARLDAVRYGHAKGLEYDAANMEGRVRIAQGLLAAAGNMNAIVGQIIGVESGGDPTAQNPRSTARGAGQFIASTWLGMVRQHRPDLAAGKSDADILALRDDPALSREMTTRFAEENRRTLHAAGFQGTAGNIYLAHFAGAAGALALLRNPHADAAETMAAVSGGRATAEQIRVANSFLRGMTGADAAAWAARKMGPSGDDPRYVEGLRAVQSRVDTDAKKLTDQVVAALDAGQRVADEQLMQAVSMVAMSSSNDDRERLTAKLTEAGVRRLIDSLPVDQAREMRAMWSAQVRAGAGPAAQLADRAAADALTRRAESVRTDPVQAFIDRQGGSPMATSVLGAPLPVVNASTPQDLGASLDQRRRHGQLAEQFHGLGPVSPLTLQDATVIGGAMNRADASTFAALTAELRSRIDPSRLGAVMEQAPIRDALAAASRSMDPAKQVAALAFFDAINRQMGQAQFDAVVPEEVRNRLGVYRTNISSPAGKIAELIQRVEDPQNRKVREEMEATGRTEAGKFTPAQIAGAISDQFRLDPTSVAPLTNDQVLALSNEWSRVYGEEYALSLGNSSVAREQASKRLRQTWGVSSVSGSGLLMRLAPEIAHGQVDGSHDWMRQQIEGELTPIFRERNMLGRVGGLPRFTVVPDSRTEEEFGAFQRNGHKTGPGPSYRVVFLRPDNGAPEFLKRADGSDYRFCFDDTRPLADAHQRQDASRANRGRFARVSASDAPEGVRRAGADPQAWADAENARIARAEGAGAFFGGDPMGGAAAANPGLTRTPPVPQGGDLPTDRPDFRPIDELDRTRRR